MVVRCCLMFAATWNGQYREIEVNAVETEPLLGMRMLKAIRLQLDTIEGGLVTIEALT